MGYYHGQFMTSAGVLSGSAFVISTATYNLAGAFGTTNYFFVWQDGSPFNTYGTFVSKSGSVGTSFQISQTTSLDQNPPDVGFDGTNFFAVWNTDTAQTPSGAPIWNLYGRLVSQSGTLTSGELLLNTNQPQLPSLAFDGTNYLLGWSYDTDTTNSDKTIFFQFFNRSADSIGPSFSPFSPQGTNSPLFGKVLFDGHRFVVTATIGSVILGSGASLNGFSSGQVYGGFIPSSAAPPTLTTSNLIGTQFPLQLIGTPGINYAIQTSTNLALSNWTTLVTNSPTNGTFSFTDTSATNKSRFYRAVKQ